MNNSYKWTVLDIEPLLMSKSFEELNVAERAFLVGHLGDEAQIKQYQKILQCTSKAVSIEPKLRPKAAIQARVRSRIQTPSVVKNGMEGFFLAFSGLLAIRSPIRSGLALAMLTLAFWFTCNLEQSYLNTQEALQDSLVYQQWYDSEASSQPFKSDSNSTITLPKQLNTAIPVREDVRNEGIRELKSRGF